MQIFICQYCSQKTADKGPPTAVSEIIGIHAQRSIKQKIAKHGYSYFKWSKNLIV